MSRGSNDMGETMVKLIAAAVVVGLAVSGPALAQKKDCGELKGEIEAKIKKNGVDKFTLDVLEADAQSDGKVVGTCEGGSKKIVYKRG
jgi:Protein of unknown function (DUF1161)